MKEVDLAERVVDFLEKDGWDVYQEVDGCDIVAVSKPFAMIVECKLRLGFDVLSQAIERKRYRPAHWVYVATPHRRHQAQLITRVLDDFGIGWYCVPKDRWRPVREEHEGALNRRANLDWLSRLRPEHKTHCKAGSPCPSTWTPFKETRKRLVDHVWRNPGCTVREAVAAIKHHYSNSSVARSRVAHYVSHGVITELKLEYHGKTPFLFPAEKQTP